MTNPEIFNLIKETAALKSQLSQIQSSLEEFNDSKLKLLYFGAVVSFISTAIVLFFTWLKDTHLFEKNEIKDNKHKKYQKAVDESKELRRIAGKLLGLHHSLRIDIHRMNNVAINSVYFYKRFKNEKISEFNDEYLRFEAMRITLDERIKLLLIEYISLVGEHCFIFEKTAVIPLLNTFLGNNFTYEFDKEFDKAENLNENKRLELLRDLETYLFNQFNTPSINIVNMLRTEGLALTKEA